MLDEGSRHCQMESSGIITRRERLLLPAGELMLRAIRAAAQMLWSMGMG